MFKSLYILSETNSFSKSILGIDFIESNSSYTIYLRNSV